MAKDKLWVIWINGWGSYVMAGTQKQAEKERVHKSKWEGAIGRKRLLTYEEIEAGETPSYISYDEHVRD